MVTKQRVLQYLKYMQGLEAFPPQFILTLPSLCLRFFQVISFRKDAQKPYMSLVSAPCL